MKLKDLAYFSCQAVRMNLQQGYRVPLSVYVVLTNRCNNNCIYCRVHDLPQEDVWATNALKRTLTEMYKSGTRRVHFTGGEPMMRLDIGELISFAKRLGLFVGMATNGFQVSKRINELKDLDIAFVSFDGPLNTHSRLRGEAYAQDAESAIKAFRLAGVRAWTTTVLTRWNVDCIEEIVDFARRNNVVANFTRLEFTSQLPSRLHPYIEDVKELLLRGEERKNAFRKLIRLKLAGAPIGSSLEYLKNALEWPYDERITDINPSKRFRCWAGKAYAHLEWDGYLYPCGWGSLRQASCANVLEYGFREAWERTVPMADCHSCSHACGVENNLVFSLNIPTIIDLFCRLQSY